MPKSIGDAVRDLGPHKTEALAKLMIDRAREPMRDAITAWLYVWRDNIPKTAAEQLRDIRDGSSENGSVER